MLVVLIYREKERERDEKTRGFQRLILFVEIYIYLAFRRSSGRVSF